MKRFLSIIICLFLLFSVMSFNVFAIGTCALDIFAKRLSNTSNSRWTTASDGAKTVGVAESVDSVTNEKYVGVSFVDSGSISLESMSSWSGWQNWSSYRGGDYYLKLTLKVPENKIPTDDIVVVLYDSSWKMNKVSPSVKGQVVDGQWCDVYIDMDAFSNDNVDGATFKFNDMKQITFKATSDIATSVQLKGIGIYEISNIATVQDITSKINKDGNYEVRVKFDSDIGADILYSSPFTIGNTSPSVMDYDSQTFEATFVYEMIPDFPGEVVLMTEGPINIFGDNGFSKRITVYNQGLPGAAAFDSYSYTLTDDDLSFSGVVRCVFDPVGDGEEISVFIALYSGDALIATQFTENSVMLNYKDTTNVLLTIQDIESTENLRAEIYIIDNETNGRPLSEVAIINL